MDDLFVFPAGPLPLPLPSDWTALFLVSTLQGHTGGEGKGGVGAEVSNESVDAAMLPRSGIQRLDSTSETAPLTYIQQFIIRKEKSLGEKTSWMCPCCPEHDSIGH